MTPRRAFAVAIFARHGAEVLLVAHKRLGTWLPAGGELEPGETPLEAARRELREETGLDGVFTPLRGAIEGEPPGLLAFEEHSAGSKGLHMNFCFVADVATREVRMNDELSDHRWVPAADEVECPENVRQLVARALRASPLDNEDVARRWIDAFNRHALDELLSLYREDAVHTSPSLREREPATNGEIRGRAALRAWWADAMERLPALRYDLLHLTASSDRVFMEYERVCPPEPTYAVAEVLVVQGGRIRASHVFRG